MRAVQQPWIKIDTWRDEEFERGPWFPSPDPNSTHRILLPGGGLFDHWEAVAQHRSGHVLITGETGTGKEELARLIVQHGSRPPGSWKAVNCAGVESTMVLSELFGHVRGAFTGATTAREGVLRSLRGGTIILDELGELSTSDQAKILRFMQNREIQPLGSDVIVKDVDVRVIATTNADFRDQSRLRQDLRNRFLFHFDMPTLCERGPYAVPGLLAEFLKPYDVVTGISIPWLLSMMGYAWPGNVRELKRYCDAVRHIFSVENERRARALEQQPKRRRKTGTGVQLGGTTSRVVCVLDETTASLFTSDWTGRGIPSGGTRTPADPRIVCGRLLDRYERAHGLNLPACDVEPPDLVANTLRLLLLLSGRGHVHPDRLPLPRLISFWRFPACYATGFLAHDERPSSPCDLPGFLRWLVKASRCPDEGLSMAGPEPSDGIGEAHRPGSMLDFAKWVGRLPSSIPDYGEVPLAGKTRLGDLIRIMRQDGRNELDIRIVELLGQGITQVRVAAETGKPKSTIHERLNALRADYGSGGEYDDILRKK